MCGWPTRACGSGPRRRRESYLKAELIIDACKATGAEAVHPGYGFLSERESFAKALAKAEHRLHRPAAQRDRGDGRQDRIEEAGAEGGGQHRPRLSRRDRDHRRSGEDRQGHRLSGDDEGLGRRRRQGHAARVHREGRPRGLRERSSARGSPASATTACSSRNSSRTRATSRSRCSATSTATSSISASANARSSAATRRWSRKRRRRSSRPKMRKAMGEQAVALARAVGYYSRGHGRADRHRRRPERQELLLPRDEHPAAGRASGDRGGDRARPGRADDPRRGGREAGVHPGRREARRLGGRDAGLCRGSVSRLPAEHRAAGPLSAAAPSDRDRATCASASTTASSRAARSACSTTR